MTSRATSRKITDRQQIGSGSPQIRAPVVRAQANSPHHRVLVPETSGDKRRQHGTRGVHVNSHEQSSTSVDGWVQDPVTLSGPKRRPKQQSPRKAIATPTPPAPQVQTEAKRSGSKEGDTDGNRVKPLPPPPKTPPRNLPPPASPANQTAQATQIKLLTNKVKSLQEKINDLQAHVLSKDWECAELLGDLKLAEEREKKLEQEHRHELQLLRAEFEERATMIRKNMEEVQKSHLLQNPYASLPSLEEEEGESKKTVKRERRAQVKRETKTDSSSDQPASEADASGFSEKGTDNSTPNTEGNRSHKRKKRDKKNVKKENQTKDKTKDPEPKSTKHLKTVLIWSKMVPEIARNVPKLKGKETLYEWRQAWEKKRRRFEAYIPRTWLKLPKSGATTSLSTQDETAEQEEIRKSVATAIMSTVDLTNKNIKDWMDDADELNPRDVYTRAVKSCQQMTVKASNQLSTAFTSTTMESTGASLLSYGKVIKELARRLAELGDPVKPEKACETYLFGLLNQFDPVRDRLRETHKKSGEYDLLETVKAVEEWATTDRCDRGLINLTVSDKKKIDAKLVAEIKELTGEATAKILQTNNANIRLKKSQHPMGDKGCLMWWAKGTCKFGQKCHFADSHVEQYKSGNSKAKAKPNPSTTAATSTSAERYRNHVCETCGNKGHTKNWKGCPSSKKNTSADTNVNTTLTSATTTTTPSNAPSSADNSHATDGDMMKQNMKLMNMMIENHANMMTFMARVNAREEDYREAVDPSNLMQLPVRSSSRVVNGN